MENLFSNLELTTEKSLLAFNEAQLCLEDIQLKNAKIAEKLERFIARIIFYDLFSAYVFGHYGTFKYTYEYYLLGVFIVLSIASTCFIFWSSKTYHEQTIGTEPTKLLKEDFWLNQEYKYILYTMALLYQGRIDQANTNHTKLARSHDIIVMCNLVLTILVVLGTVYCVN